MGPMTAPEVSVRFVSRGDEFLDFTRIGELDTVGYHLAPDVARPEPTDSVQSQR